MKSLENVIVTLRLHPREVSLDMELPAFLPMEELTGKVLETLWNTNIMRYDDGDTLQISADGRKLGNADTLASQGIWDGSVLDASCVWCGMHDANR